MFIVITPLKPNQRIQVTLDGRTIEPTEAGIDVQGGYIHPDTPRLYELIKLTTQEDHTLELHFETPDVEVFAFTFG